MEFSSVAKDYGITDEELQALTPSERKILDDLVRELQDTGSSNTLKSVWFEDYDEVPVDIETFIRDENYLGSSIGDSLYPFWFDVLKTLFAPGSKYFECILSGAIGIGKTTVADIGLAYMLYRLLCLKQPQKFYGLTPGSIMTVNFFNITRELAESVSYAKFQQMLVNSPWFAAHGTIVGRNNKVYVPGKSIQINSGSQERHALGQDVFCVSGDTEILTIDGVKKIEELEGEETRVYQVDESGNQVLSDPCEILLTSYTTELMEIELEDGGVLQCTPNHRLKLVSGEYKRAADLTVDDELAESERRF